MVEFADALIAAYHRTARLPEPPPAVDAPITHPVPGEDRPGIEAIGTSRYRVRWWCSGRGMCRSWPMTDAGLAEARACRAAHPLRKTNGEVR